MGSDNRSGKRRRKIWKTARGPAARSDVDLSAREPGVTALHMACLYGQVAEMQLMVESGRGSVHSSDSQGRRPIHMVLSSQSSPNTTACLRYLLQNGAGVNVTTVSGLSPLHVAASEGLLECTEILVQAGADVLAVDNMGHTPLDLARIWCRREVARYLKNHGWTAEKKKEMEERKQVQALYSDLVDLAKVDNVKKRTLIDEKVAEWTNNKGFPVLKGFSPRVQLSHYHSLCRPSDQDSSGPDYPEGLFKDKPRQAPPASTSRPWTIYLGLQPDKPLKEPDLRDCVTVWRDSSSRRVQYSTKWDRTPRAAPDLPLDLLKRVFFPRAFPSRIVSLQHFEAQNITAVQHRGRPQGRSSSPWTEVAMHLAEVLEPGHY
ncbi:ankyrin repeat domain-containing protein 53 [Betta splendens]|uniref:Ankyrin repeat domain-containing protein 53 n=1 Tax=Betta splendens TaxID=158456 RepID=A0A6P7LTN2_BETSP|nr:ankyrin repeat domain-containing protein 53 [Betta splendens]XP_040925175.1 ankyrin repeat domain-containing protein 53 [Betta splendens]